LTKVSTGAPHRVQSPRRTQPDHCDQRDPNQRSAPMDRAVTVREVGVREMLVRGHPGLTIGVSAPQLDPQRHTSYLAE
jgi:hypothetical protein